MPLYKMVAEVKLLKSIKGDHGSNLVRYYRHFSVRAPTESAATRIVADDAGHDGGELVSIELTGTSGAGLDTREDTNEIVWRSVHRTFQAIRRYRQS